jgi:hypothetical protein
MKNLLLLASIICFINCYSQEPNPELFQTWHLTFVQGSDLDTPINVVEILPAVTPSLTISNDLNFIVEGACNTYSGSFTNVTSDYFEIPQFSPSLLTCSSQMQNSFEESYFGFFQSVSFYQISPEGQGLILTMYNPVFGSAVFTNLKLDVDDFDFSQMTIYPNPIESNFTLKSDKLKISRIQIINSFGQNVKTIQNEFGNIDISNLNSGVYILKIDTEFGILHKKIIKRN